MTARMISLLFEKDGARLFRYPVEKDKLSIGRDPSCDVVLTDPDISRLQAEIFFHNGEWFIKNIGRASLTVNKNSFTESKLNGGDKIGISNWAIGIETERSEEERTVSGEREETKIINYDVDKKVVTYAAIKVFVKNPDGTKTEHKFKREKITIGKSADNEIVLNDDYASGKHCKLTMTDGTLLLTDLGSTNGTFFEGEKIGKMLLPDGAEFTAGKTIISARNIETEEKVKEQNEDNCGMIGSAASMKEIFSLIAMVAETDATVCISGESGTGKELVAGAIHKKSARADKPFVAINCGAIPPNIIESELFGHEKGAFTGAMQSHAGVFEQANGGTLFLDEIGEMPIDMQTRLLRVIETRTVRRVGGQRDIPFNVRVIAATNQDLKKNVRAGKFREDLFYRLYVIPINIPPLRERSEDIEQLANHFVKVLSPDGGGKLTAGAVEALKKHRWPGNVRELKNTIQRAIIMSRGGDITGKHIGITELDGAAAEEGPSKLFSQEKEMITKALRECRGNQSKAAELLGIARTTLGKKVRSYEIDLVALNIK